MPTSRLSTKCQAVKSIGALILFVATAAIAVNAAVPQLIPYQGRLTDSLGDPVPDGLHQVKFIIYDAGTVGADLWNSGFRYVSTEGGLFTYALGSSVDLPDDLFTDATRYLGITIMGSPEGTPRIQLETTPYAYHTLRADSAGYANNAELLDGMNSTDFVDVSGDEMTGTLGFANGSTPMTYMYRSGTTNSARAVVAHSPGFPDWGLMYDDLNDEFVITGNGDTNLVVKPYGDGDNAVRLGEDAISADEIFDEPGIAQGHNANALELDTSMTDVTTVTITIPKAGFIFLLGHARIYYWLGGGNSGATYFQIDETAGGDPIPGIYSFVTFNSYNHVDCTTQRTYFKGAGSYTFRLEAKRLRDVDRVRVYWPTLTAIYLPSSYGEVWSVAPDPNDDAGAKAIEVSDPRGSEGSTATTTMYEVDLRALEIKAGKARREALRLELELERALNRQATNR